MKTSKRIYPSTPGCHFQIKILALAAGLIAPATTGLAQTFWQGPANGSADYNTPADWVGGVVPTGGSANPANDNGSNSVILIQAGDPTWSINSLRAGWGNNASGSYLQTGGTVTTALKYRLAAGNNGTANNSPNSGSVAYYTLNGGTINCGNDFNIGELGTAVLNVNGGAINLVNGNFGDNNYNGSGNTGVNSVTDVVNQTAGIISLTGTGQLFVGNGGSAIYNLSGGTNTVNNYIAFGRSGGNGTVNMTGGLLVQNGGGNLLVGTGFQNPSGGTPVGVLNQSAGTINCKGQFLCPETSPAVGTYNLSGTGSLVVNSWLVFGRSGGGGTLNISGGSILQTNSNGGNCEIGEGTSGTVNQTGGSVTIASNDIWIGQGGGASGIYNMNGGSLSVNSWIAVGRQGGNGTLNLTNGTVTKTGNTGNHFDVGAGGTGTINQYGGLITNAVGDFWLGESAPATWNFNGGTAILQNLVMCVDASASAQLNLNCGLFQVTSITCPTTASSISLLSLNGATLQANANNSTFISGIFQNTIGPSGITIDSQGFAITIPDPLADGGGGTLTKIGSGALTLTGANSYAGTTAVSAGTLATTTASGGGGGYTVANGAILNVQVVNSLNGQINMSGLTFSSSATTLGIDLNNFGNPSAAPVNVGTLTVNGTVSINILDALPQIGQFPLISYASKTGSSYVLGSLPVGVIAHLVDNTANNSIDLDITSVNLPRWDGNAGGNWDIGLTTNWVNSATGLPTFYGQGNAVTFDDNATGTTNVNLVAAVTPGSVTINNNTLIYTLTGSGSINGSIGILKEGASSFAMDNTNGYTGPTTITGGTLSVNNLANGGSPSAIGASSANPTNLVLANATLIYTGPGVSVNRGYSLQNTNSTIDTEGNLTLSGTVASVAAADFIKAGPAQLTYATVGVNALSGSTSLGYRTINGTTVFDGSPGGQTNNVLGHFGVGGLGGTNAAVILTNSTLNVPSGGIDLGRSGGAVGTLTVGGSAVLNANSGNFALGDGNGVASTGIVNQVGGVINVSGPQMFVGQNISGVGSYTLSGGTLNINNWLALGRQGGFGVFNISGNGALVKTGGGNLDIGTSAGIGGFSGTGVLNQSGGAITNTASQTWLGEGALGQPANGTWNMTGGTALLGELHVGVGGTGTNTVNISGPANITCQGFLGLSLNDTNTVGNLNMGSASQPGGIITVQSDMTVGDQGAANLNFVAGGGAQLTVSGTLYLSRSSPQANGTINLNAGNTLIASFVNNGWGFHNNFPSPTNNPNALNFNGGTLRALVGSQFFIQPYVNAVVQSGGAVIDDGGFDVAVLAALTDGGGGGGLTKLGNGTLNLIGVNTYTGNTVINAGTLAGTGSIASHVTVASGGALGAGSDAIGTLNISNTLTFAAGSTSFMKLGTSSFDQIAGLTGVAYNGALVVTNTTGSPLTAGNVYQLFRSAAPGSGNFTSVTLLPSGAATFNPATGQLTITSSGALTFNPITYSNGNLVVTGSGGTAGTGYTLLTTTNLVNSIATWTTNTTGTFDGTGSFSNSIPVNVSQPTQFFRVRTP